MKIIGRDSDLINVGGVKFMPSEVELIILKFSNIKHAKVYGKINPITGQHVEAIVEPSSEDFSKVELAKFLKIKLTKTYATFKNKSKRNQTIA